MTSHRPEWSLPFSSVHIAKSNSYHNTVILNRICLHGRCTFLHRIEVNSMVILSRKYIKTKTVLFQCLNPRHEGGYVLWRQRYMHFEIGTRGSQIVSLTPWPPSPWEVPQTPTQGAEKQEIKKKRRRLKQRKENGCKCRLSTVHL